MSKRYDYKLTLTPRGTQTPERDRKLKQLEVIALVIGVIAAVVERGLMHITTVRHWELGFLIVLSMFLMTGGAAMRGRSSLSRSTFFKDNRPAVVLGIIWAVGFVLILIFGPFLPDWSGRPVERAHAILGLSELLVVLRGMAAIGRITSRATAGGINPALVLVGTFVLLIGIGTVLLMLPRSRSDLAPADEPLGDRFRIALFTATSASCVTGLTVVPTNEYWSRTGQAIIMGLFQVGGLGIMTCGAFFAVAAGNQLQIRESAALRDLLESNALGDVTRMLRTIVAFTFAAELLGAIGISGLFSHMPLGDQIFYSVFHSVSAFCNAGFALTDDSFVGFGTRWQVMFVVTSLIVAGGLGFSVIYNSYLVARTRLKTLKRPPLFSLPAARARFTLSSRLILLTTAGLLVFGAAGYYLLESMAPFAADTPVSQRVCDAWFQSVTFRTAGFNTVDHENLQPATKLFAMLLMFVGASPGSTGGGVKTVAFALTILALVATLRGRRNVEYLGRRIPDQQITHALTIITLGVFAILAAAGLLVLFENKPERFVDHMYEATSAFATVGVSAGITPHLTPPSQFVIVVTMLVGRVGPLTLLMALHRRTDEARYEYPEERITLG